MHQAQPGLTGWIYTRRAYDGLDRPYQVSLPYTDTVTAQSTTTYDALGRPETVYTPGSGTVTYTYTGTTVQVVDANQHVTQYDLTASGQVSTTREYTGTHPNHTPYATTTYGYDPLGNLTTITDDENNATAITYDGLGRKIAMDDPDMGRWRYEYNAEGNLVTQADARGVVITHTYDALDRLTGKAYDTTGATQVATTTSVVYTYTGSYRTGMQDGSGSTHWDHDPAGRVLTGTKVISGQPHVTGYRYDALGRLGSMVYPDGEVVTTTYDTQGLPDTVRGDTDYLSDASYNMANLPTRWALGDVATQSLSYDSFFRLNGLSAVNGSSETLQNLGFSFDALGRLSSYADNVANFNLGFTYDPLNRLDRVTSVTYPQDYGYDTIGNLTLRDSLVLTYGHATKPHVVSSTSDGTSYGYDDNGNLITKTLSSGRVVTYTYNAENRLTQVISETGSSVLTTSLVYDGDGQRVKRVAPDGTATTYIGDYFEQRGSGIVVDLSWTFDTDELPWLLECVLYDCYPDISDITWDGNDGSPSSGSIHIQSSYWPTATHGDLAHAYMHNASYLSDKMVTTDSELTFRYQITNTWSDPIEIVANLLRPEVVVYAEWIYGSKDWTTVTVPLSSYAGRSVSQITLFGVLDDYEQWNCDIFFDSVSITNLEVLDPPTKHYYAGGQRLATRVGDEVYYTPPDPTGTSLLLVDTNGITQGHVLYDGYGGILTSTLPATLTTALAGQAATPDPDTGLVYLGDGRWYDPALGRPLQPNPLGGPPTLPQALNRYAPTPWGAPGVAQGAANNVFNWTPHAVGFAKNLSVELAGIAPIVAGYRYTGLVVIEVTASRTALTRGFPAQFGRSFTDPVFAFAEKGRSFYSRRGFFTLTADSLEGLRGSADDTIALLEKALPSRNPWAARMALKDLDVTGTQPIYGSLDDLSGIKSFRTGINAGLDFFIGFGFQYLEDIHNPYLSPRQTTSRALLSGSLGALSALGLAALCPETAGITCLVLAGTTGGIAWSLTQDPFFRGLEHLIFSPLGVHILPVRNLYPLEE